MEALCKFFVSILLLLLSWIIFCGDGFDGGAGKSCPRTENVVVMLRDLSLKKELHYSIVLFFLLSFVLSFVFGEAADFSLL